MTGLHEIQDKFTRAILDERPDIIAQEIVTDGLSAGERHNIYRNNSFITLGLALGQNFPVLCRLAGQRFFDHLAREYVKEYPPETPLLMTYGALMPGFLVDFKPTADLPYLAHVARLEHLWNKCFNGPDSQDFDPEELHKVDPERLDDVIFSLLPNICLMSSPYPVLDIWLANQDHPAEDYDNISLDDNINLDDGPCYLAIFRKGQEVEVMSLDRAGYDFLGRLRAGDALGYATEKITAEHPDFDLQKAIQNIIANEMIESFTLSEGII